MTLEDSSNNSITLITSATGAIDKAIAQQIAAIPGCEGGEIRDVLYRRIGHASRPHCGIIKKQWL
jgi:hypothetical protein